LSRGKYIFQFLLSVYKNTKGFIIGNVLHLEVGREGLFLKSSSKLDEIRR
jgi:hypothetical protein